jgi:hypothetical protein
MSPSGRKSIDCFASCHRREGNQSIDLLHVTVGTKNNRLICSMSPSGRKTIDCFAPCHRRDENQSIVLLHVTVGTENNRLICSMSPSGRKSIDSFAPCHRREEKQSVDLSMLSMKRVIQGVFFEDCIKVKATYLKSYLNQHETLIK